MTKSYEEILYIGQVVHQANIDVDEKGTEAAAATAVIMADTGGGCIGSDPVPRKTITLRLNHPFLFVLRDVETALTAARQANLTISSKLLRLALKIVEPNPTPESP